MLNSPCVVKYSIIYRACGALDAELCTTSWAPVLTNSKFSESIFTYIWYISCVYQMQQKLQAIRCFDAVIVLFITSWGTRRCTGKQSDH